MWTQSRILFRILAAQRALITIAMLAQNQGVFSRIVFAHLGLGKWSMLKSRLSMLLCQTLCLAKNHAKTDP